VIRAARGRSERGGNPRSARPIPKDAKQPAYSAGPIKHLSSGATSPSGANLTVGTRRFGPVRQLESTPSRSCGGAKIKQTVRKVDLSGFLCDVGDVRIAHGSHRRLRA
jgi:hypothetical protein